MIADTQVHSFTNELSCCWYVD